MTIEIKLDATALDALFPEGSEARLKITKGTAENFLHSRLRSGITEAVRQDIDGKIAAARSSAQAEIEKEFLEGNKSSWSSSWKPTETLQKIIRGHTEQAIHDQIRETINAAMSRKDIAAYLERQAESALKQYSEAAIAKLLKQRLEAALAAIKA